MFIRKLDCQFVLSSESAVPNHPDILPPWKSVLTIGLCHNVLDTPCTVCLETLAAPRIAPCGHVLCFVCSLRYIRKVRVQSVSVGASPPCPICNAPGYDEKNLRPVYLLHAVPSAIKVQRRLKSVVTCSDEKTISFPLSRYVSRGARGAPTDVEFFQRELHEVLERSSTHPESTLEYRDAVTVAMEDIEENIGVATTASGTIPTWKSIACDAAPATYTFYQIRNEEGLSIYGLSASPTKDDSVKYFTQSNDLRRLYPALAHIPEGVRYGILEKDVVESPPPTPATDMEFPSSLYEAWLNETDDFASQTPWSKLFNTTASTTVTSSTSANSVWSVRAVPRRGAPENVGNREVLDPAINRDVLIDGLFQGSDSARTTNASAQSSKKTGRRSGKTVSLSSAFSGNK